MNLMKTQENILYAKFQKLQITIQAQIKHKVYIRPICLAS